MNWDDIRVFLALARDPRLNAAAKSLGVNPTTISRRLGRLSETLDGTLFKQEGGRHILTDLGVQLLENAEQVEAAVLEMQQVSAYGRLSSGIKVALPESLAVWFVGPKMADFQEAHPNIHVNLISPAVYHDPVKGEVDIAIVPTRPLRGRLTARKIVSFTVHLYASQEYLDANGPIVNAAELSRLRFVSLARELTRSIQYRDYLRQFVPDYIVGATATSMIVQANILATGGGIGLLPHYVAHRFPTLRPVLANEIALTRNFWLVIREDVRRSPRVVSFLKWFIQLMRENPTFFRGPTDDPVAERI